MKILLLIISICCTLIAFTQPQDTLYSRSYGGPFYDVGSEILETADGGYMILGTTGSALNATTDFYLLKIDEDLDFEWSMPLGGGDVDQGNCMASAEDDYLLGGFSKSAETTYDFRLYKVDSDGQVIWTYTYGGPGWEFGEKIAVDMDGNIYFLGTTHGDTAGGTDLLLLKLDGDGTEIWTSTYGGAEDEEVADIAILPDGNIAIHATSWSYTNDAHSQSWLFVIDSEGNTVWENLGGEFSRFAGGMEIMDDGIVTVGGNAFLVDQPISAYTQKFSFEGDVYWERLESSAGLQYYNDVVFGGAYYAVSGYTEFFGLGPSDVLINRRNVNGYWVTGLVAGGDYEEDGTEIMVDSQGRILILGWTTSFAENFEEDVLVIRLASDTIAASYITNQQDYDDVSLDIVEQEFESAVFPNPSLSKATFVLKLIRFDRIVILNTQGQIVFEDEFGPSSRKEVVHNLPPGMYFYSLLSGGQKLSSDKLAVR